LHNLAVAIAEQWINDFCEVGESFLREWRVAADTDDFSVLGLEKCMVVRTGRL